MSRLRNKTETSGTSSKVRVVIALIVMGFLMPITFFATPAMAASASDPAVKQTVVSEGETTVTTTVNSVDHAAANYTEVMNMMAGGLPKSQQRGCVTIKKAGKNYYLGGRKIRVGMKYWTDYWAYGGAHVWHWKTVQRGDKFCIRGKNIIRVQCGNTSVFGKVAPGPVITGNIKIVLKFTLNATATATSETPVSVSVTASCGSGSNSATATATASATAKASATATASASSYAEVTAKVSAAARAKLSASITAQAVLDTTASVTTTATAKAYAKVECNGGSNQPPVVSIVNAPQHVIVNGQVRICALASDADGNSLLVTFSAVYGTVSVAFQPDPSGSPQQWCTTYTAPASPVSNEIVSVTATDGVLSASASTPPFPIAADTGF